MRKDEINEKLTEQAFDFFYWFSRFEFAESAYLTIHIESTKKAKLVFERFMNNLQEVA
ncbi:hypothetical protein VCRA2121O337_20105 [Vibrio crassostreae]|nr:hypothetical protein VCRA2120E331_20147 [Vibrio crassostreae]CAK3412745.1 hypothetical protein VCRA2127O345_20105 [Vibrio crassostreae]CAK3453980.1 hypothetical protein VCRA2122O338_20147 [Vibrio crassostreae]CAK3841318.1 hypothetical protein VCRA2121O337_20105 [Vibrio crassostreae]CAK3877838.1 hypothetical protein VCRA2128O346_20148 [Vibrio crassostreae]